MSNQAIAASRNIFASKISFLQRHWRSVWILVFTGGLIFAHRYVSDQQTNPLQISVIHRPIAMGMIGIILWPHIIQRPQVFLKGVMIPLHLFIIWRLISALWSAHPLWTVYRSLEFLTIIALITYTTVSMRSFYDLRKWMNWVWGWIGILIASVWIGLIFNPDQALKPINNIIPFMLNGVFPRIHSNTVSHLGAVLAVVGMCRIFEQRRIKWLILFLWGLATTILSQGRSGMAGLIFGVVLVLILYKRLGLLLGLILLTAFIIIEPNLNLLIEFAMRGQEYEVFSGLSGRFDKWRHAWMFIQESPILGYGAFAGARFFIMPEISGYYSQASSTHSTWIELLVNVGFVGLCLFVLVIIKLFFSLLIEVKKTVIQFNKSLYIEVLAVLSVLIVRSFFTHVMVNHNSFPFFVVLGLAFFLRQSKLKKYNNAHSLKV